MLNRENSYPPELEQFFSRAREMKNGDAFLNSLRPLLTPEIISKKGNDLCDAIHNLRTNQIFMDFLLSNWQLSEVFLETVLANASSEKKQAIKSSRLGIIYQLNALRRAVLPQQVRIALPINEQQLLILRALSASRRARAARAVHPIIMPELPPAGARTQIIERLEKDGDIEIPNELICPLSCQMFVDPVKVTQNNITHYFERGFIEQALNQKAENPLTREPLAKQDLMDAPEKKAEVEAYKNDLINRINNAARPMVEERKEHEPTLSKNRQKHLEMLQKNNIHTPLTLAAAGNDFKNVDKELPQADVNWQGIFGNTALHWAVANTNPTMALHIIEKAKKLNFNIQDYQGKTALHLAIGKGWYHFNENHKNTTTPQDMPQAPVIQKLIEKTDLNIKDKNGNTALHIAMIRRDYNCLELLLKQGANINIVNHAGQKPIDMLKLSYPEASQFIKEYVRVFTLDQKIWLQALAPINALLQSQANSGEEKFEQASGLSSPVKNGSIHLTPSGELKGPPEVIFEQAIYFLEDLLEPALGPDRPAISQACTRIIAELKKLKDETLLNHNHTPHIAQHIADHSLILAQKIAYLTITPEDITRFQSETAKHIHPVTYKNPSILAQILGALVGASLGLLTGIMAGMAAGPAAAFTGLYGVSKGAIIGASVGASLGGALGFWGVRKALQTEVQPPEHPFAASAREMLDVLARENLDESEEKLHISPVL